MAERSGAEPNCSYPPYRPYLARVHTTERLSPTFVRIVFTGPFLHHFGTAGLDQRIKIVFPPPGKALPDLGQHDDWTPESFTWYHRWRELPEAAEYPIRTYTAAEADPESGTVTVDFAAPAPFGPGSKFALEAKAGDPVIIVGPDARSFEPPIGIDFRPGTANQVLLACDETGLPALRAILRAAPEECRFHAFVEVPEVEDCSGLAGLPAELTVVTRSGDRGAGLLKAVETWCDENEAALGSAVEESENFYAWLAAEAGVTKALRRLLVQNRGVDRRQVCFMGYWREGKQGV